MTQRFSIEAAAALPLNKSMVDPEVQNITKKEESKPQLVLQVSLTGSLKSTKIKRK
jgi:hypothetical protein